MFYIQGILMLDNVFHLLTIEYSLILATSQEHFQALKEVRADVFEHRYAQYPDLKKAKWFLFSQDDEQSFIYLLQHNETKKYVGSVRIFFVNKNTPVQTIPMQRDCKVKDIETLTHDLPICEVSRLSLIHDQVEHNTFSELQLRTYLSLALMSATRLSFLLNDYEKMFAIMERSLHLILKRQSVAFTPIGDAVDYYGVRFPFVINKEDLSLAIEKTEKTMGKLTKYYLLELCKSPEPFWNFIDDNPYLERSDIHLDKICQIFKEYGEDVTMKTLLEEMDNLSIAT